MSFICIGNYSFNISDTSVFYTRVKNAADIEKFKIYHSGAGKTPPTEEIETIFVMKNGLSYHIKGDHLETIKLQLAG